MPGLMSDKLPIFERDDDSDVTDAVAGIADLATLAEGVLLVEKYGLSVVAELIDDSVEWVATDPLSRFQGRAYSPVGAVLLWDYNRQDVEGKDEERPRLRLVKEQP